MPTNAGRNGERTPDHIVGAVTQAVTWRVTRCGFVTGSVTWCAHTRSQPPRNVGKWPIPSPCDAGCAHLVTWPHTKSHARSRHTPSHTPSHATRQVTRHVTVRIITGVETGIFVAQIVHFDTKSTHHAPAAQLRADCRSSAGQAPRSHSRAPPRPGIPDQRT